MLTLLNNTFVGTLLAGGILALLGLCLYRWQKRIDIQYEDLKKIRELASLSFASIDIAAKDFRGQLNIYDDKYPQLKLVNDAVNARFGDLIREAFDKRFNQHVIEIEKALSNLVAQLKIYGDEKSDGKASLLTEKIAMLNMYLLGFSVLGNLKKEEIAELKNNFEETVSIIYATLHDLIRQKV